MMKRADVEELKRQLVALIGLIESGGLEASASYLCRLQGAAVALDAVTGSTGSLADLLAE